MTKSRNTAASTSTPQNVLLVFGAMACEKPVPTASTNTRSLISSIDSALSTNGKGGVPDMLGSPVSRRFGPNDPRCSHTVADPGPPL
jgi:hypothetical protein